MDKETTENPVEKVILFFKKIPGSIKRLLEKINAGFSGENPNFKVPDWFSAFWRRIRKISADKALLIWALVIIAGILLFRLFSGNLLGPVTNTSLVFATWWEDELKEETLTTLIEEFESKNHGVTITLERMNWEEIRKLLDEERRQSGQTNKKEPIKHYPDIFSIDPYDIHELEDKSYLATLKTKAASSGNMLPVISFINPLFYNIDLLKAAGFNRPPKNQTEFLSYVQRVNETSGAYGAGLALRDSRDISWHILSWIWAALGNPETAESFNFNTKEVIGTLNFLNQLSQHIFPYPLGLGEDELLEAFGKGRVAMIIGSVSNMRELKKTNINFDITTIPAPESYTRKPIFSLTTWYIGINKQSLYQDEAQNFIAFLKGKAETIAVAAYAVPGSGNRNRDLSKDDPSYSKAFDMYAAGETVRDLFLTPELEGINNIVRREIELMFRGHKTPEQCAETIQQNWESLRKKLL